MDRNKPYTVGITGGIGSGKSTAAKYLSEKGFYHIDADAISRALTAPGGRALGDIRAAFGDGVFRPDGTLDRAALASVVFSSADRRRVLEGILHPMVLDGVTRELRNAALAGKPALLDVPLLFESGMDRLCDEVWTVTCPEDTRVARVCARDGLSESDVRSRIRSQMSDAEREKRSARAIPNDAGRDELINRLDEALLSLPFPLCPD